MDKKTMLFFIFAYFAAFAVQADILAIDCLLGKTLAVETRFSSEKFTVGFRLREDDWHPDRFIFQSGIFGFGRAQYSGFMQLYFAKAPSTAARLFNSAGARIYDDASAESFVFSAVTPWTVYLLVCGNDIADNVFAVTLNNADAGLIISKRNSVSDDEYYNEEITYGSIIRPFVDMHMQTDILRLFIAGSLSFSANLPLSGMVSAGINADIDDFSSNFSIVYWSEHYVDSGGKMSGRFVDNSVSLMKIFGDVFSVSLSNHLVLDKIPSYEICAETKQVFADNETILSASADPLSFLHIFLKSGFSAVNTGFDNLELKHTAGFRINAGIISLSFKVHYRETKFISQYSFLALLDMHLKHADIFIAWKPDVYLRTALVLSWPGFSCRIAAKINKSGYEEEIGISLKNL